MSLVISDAIDTIDPNIGFVSYDLLMNNNKIDILKYEYTILAKIILNLQNHINISFTENIILNNDRIDKLKELNDIIKLLNNTYNTNITNITKVGDINNLDYSFIIKDIIPDFHKIITLNNNNNNNRPFDNIRQKLIAFTAEIGFDNIIDTIYILFDRTFDTIINNASKNNFNILNMFFRPTKYIFNNNNIFAESIDENLFTEILDIDSEFDLHNYIKIHIKHNKSILTIIGFFNTDSSNIFIRTAQISNNFIYKSKKNLENITNSIDIDDKFKNNYIKNIQLYDIFTYNISTYAAKIKLDYVKFNNIIKLTFVNLMKLFTSSKLKDMYYIIFLLLLGSDDNINFANLLFSLTKDKQIDSHLISNIIFKYLPLNLQIKLKKANINIKSEIDKIKNINLDDADLKKLLISQSHIPINAKKAALEKIEEMKASNNDYYKQLQYVKIILNFPWPKPEDDLYFKLLNSNFTRAKEFIQNSCDSLDSVVYGHTECKNEIKQIIAKWISNPNGSGGAIGLVGPPGVGKTLLAKGLGKALNIPFVQLTLGGQNDGELLHGHGYTYSGSQPGLIVKKMVEAGQSRCVFYFDELDKTSKKNDTNEISNIMIHLIDPNTNSEFQDRFFQEITFPLNKAIFVFSYNDSDLLDPILRDRIKEIHVNPYTLKDKINITQKFSLKELCDNIGIDRSLIIIQDNVIEYIIEHYTNEAGVRSLKRCLEKILMKVNYDRIIDNYKIDQPIHIDINTIHTYMDKPHLFIRKIHIEPMLGIINGMYATDSGKGGILPIHIYGNYLSTNDFDLKLTGSQGKVMKESVYYSFNTAINMVSVDNKNSFYKTYKNGLHIHTPSGATPKDGPSAGGAFTICFLSMILNKKIKNYISITGEIEPTGRLCAIGGLHYKLMGAKKAGVTHVFIPTDNESDFNKIILEDVSLINDSFKVTICENIKYILKDILIDYVDL